MHRTAHSLLAMLVSAHVTNPVKAAIGDEIEIKGD
jgi:hypothetical protein